MSCLGCQLARGEVSAPGGEILRTPDFVAHALVEPCPLPGWVVMTSVAHVRAVYALDDRAAAALGPLVKRIMAAQRSALGAVHSYVFALGDVLAHAHLHLVPRYADTPAALQGRRAFDAPPASAAPVEEIAAAAASLRAALTS